MNQIVTSSIVLARTNFGEADRILTVLTPDRGKLRLIAKGVRRIKSRLAGGVELFSVSRIAFIKGRGEIGTLVSAKLDRYYGNIVDDIERVQLGYELLKLLNKTVEDDVEPEYFELLERTLRVLDDPQYSLELVKTWFAAQLLRLGGRMPNLRFDIGGGALSVDSTYEFDFNAMALDARPDGHFTADHVKYLRLIFSDIQPRILQQVSGWQDLLPECMLVVQTMLNTFIRI